MTAKSRLVKNKALNLAAFDKNTAAKKANPKLHSANRLKLVQHFNDEITQLENRLKALNAELKNVGKGSR